MQLEKPQLFSDTKSFVWVMLFLGAIILVRLLFSYQEYRSFISKPFYYTYADVVSVTEKFSRGKRYQSLKLHSDDGLIFYTTSYKKEEYRNRRLRLQIFPDEAITFRGYLSAFFVRSRIKEVESLPGTFKDTLRQKVASQHSDTTVSSFYNAIFFATPLDKELREQVSKLGVSHLVALSGFHLGILWGLVYGALLLFYRPIQQRYFPYRFSLIDIGAVSVMILALYVWFVDAPPSLVRSYAMVLTGWMVLILGMELVSFWFLGSVVMAVTALFPSLLVSLGFWFSVAGVFAIFLLLRYFKEADKRAMTFLVIPVGVFLLMLPIVHGIFGVTSHYQLLSPLLSVIFIGFYPLSMVFHLLGFGGVMDEWLLRLFALPQGSEQHLLEFWAVGVYIVVALAAVKSKNAFTMLVAMAVAYAAYLFV